jgi:hypothetical protein
MRSIRSDVDGFGGEDEFGITGLGTKGCEMGIGIGFLRY